MYEVILAHGPPPLVFGTKSSKVCQTVLEGAQPNGNCIAKMIHYNTKKYVNMLKMVSTFPKYEKMIYISIIMISNAFL